MTDYATNYVSKCFRNTWKSIFPNSDYFFRIDDIEMEILVQSVWAQI